MLSIERRGEQSYLYGVGRMPQYSATCADYFGFAGQSLTDALGSVRQLVDAEGEVGLAQSYEPYGETLNSSGERATSYGFDGEWTDTSGLVFLRARYYAPAQGRFLSRDAWEGDYEMPISYNGWLYTYANPINGVDPTGNQCSGCRTPGDWAAFTLHYLYGVSIGMTFQDNEKVLILETVTEYANLLGGPERFKRNVALHRIEEGWTKNPTGNEVEMFNLQYNPTSKTITVHYDWYMPVIISGPTGGIHIGLCQPDVERLLRLPEGSLPSIEVQSKFYLAHEMSHALHEGNLLVFDSFSRNVNLPPAFLAGSDPNPLISRNAGRSAFKFEVLADMIAAFLYSPGLLNQDMRDWITFDMPGVLR